MTQYEQAAIVANFLAERLEVMPAVWVVLGSGLGAFADTLNSAQRFAYTDLPHFPPATVAGHGGAVIVGQCQSVTVGVMQGRFHYYEGYELDQVTLPIRVAKLLGGVRPCRPRGNRLIVTNAAGGLNPNFTAGDLMLITDHINLLGANPLRGIHDERFGARFPDLTAAYDPDYRRIALESADQLGLTLQQGIYVAVAGPTYETPAETRMLQAIAADAVGMSTVPEVIVARQMGMRVLGISCITNLAAGIANHPLSHQDVLATGQRASSQLIALLQHILPRLCEADPMV
ncbi:MAG: purine-nucleoside phosphorylase [Aphanocapsa sp. GSE-SYN-MK-11-07L]|jgi:purine-nucleoside phosphorylase|nr:purine-nucleoside phosphorylase [Aphanocapsa sp. GSE-SYN-MK-11-07L]